LAGVRGRCGGRNCAAFLFPAIDVFPWYPFGLSAVAPIHGDAGQQGADRQKAN
jgi:hypothetical protein